MRKTQVFSGHAQIPTGLDLYENYKYLTILVEVDGETGEIVNCSVPIYCKLHNDFLADIFIGKSLSSDINLIIKEIGERCHTVSNRALITAIQMLHNRYTMIVNNSSLPPKRLV